MSVSVYILDTAEVEEMAVDMVSDMVGGLDRDILDKVIIMEDITDTHIIMDTM
jgi:hypothetical protein